VGNGFRCTLAQIAECLGAESGSVTHIYLPRWFARNLPAIDVPLIVLAGYLNARNLQEARTGSDDVNCASATFPSVVRAGSALPSAGESSSHAGVRRSCG
jgi:hypothetical protein